MPGKRKVKKQRKDAAHKNKNHKKEKPHGPPLKVWGPREVSPVSPPPLCGPGQRKTCPSYNYVVCPLVISRGLPRPSYMESVLWLYPEGWQGCPTWSLSSGHIQRVARAVLHGVFPLVISRGNDLDMQ